MTNAGRSASQFTPHALALACACMQTKQFACAVNTHSHVLQCMAYKHI